MTRILWKKAFRDSYLLFVGCGSVLLLFCWIRVWIISDLGMARFKKILDSIPKSWQKILPVPVEELVSYPGQLAVTFEEPVVYLMMAIWCIARSSDVVSGQLGRGTMEMLLSQPVSRKQVFLTQTWVTLLGVIGLSFISYLGTYAGIATTSVTETAPPLEVPFLGLDIPFTSGTETIEVPMQEKVAPIRFLPAAVNYFGLGVFLVGFTTLMSSWDRYRWRTIAITVGFYILSTIVELLGMAVEGFEWVKFFTFFAAYEPIRFVSSASADSDLEWAWIIQDAEGAFLNVGPLGGTSILVLLGAIGIGIGTWIFCRRDLPAPI